MIGFWKRCELCWLRWANYSDNSDNVVNYDCIFCGECFEEKL